MKWLSRRLLSIRTQMVIVFVVCSLIIASLIASVSLHVLYSAMEKQAAAALSDVASRINTEMQSLIEEATRLLNWGNVSRCFRFFLWRRRAAPSGQRSRGGVSGSPG